MIWSWWLANLENRYSIYWHQFHLSVDSRQMSNFQSKCSLTNWLQETRKETLMLHTCRRYLQIVYMTEHSWRWSWTYDDMTDLSWCWHVVQSQHKNSRCIPHFTILCHCVQLELWVYTENTNKKCTTRTWLMWNGGHFMQSTLATLLM